MILHIYLICIINITSSVFEYDMRLMDELVYSNLLFYIVYFAVGKVPTYYYTFILIYYIFRIAYL